LTVILWDLKSGWASLWANVLRQKIKQIKKRTKIFLKGYWFDINDCLGRFPLSGKMVFGSYKSIPKNQPEPKL
jgi:hypothetical protein